MPALARSASKDGELPVSVADQEPGNPRRDQVVAVRRLGDGGDLQHLEIRRIVDALTP
jgi:hypothetical protein